MIWTFVLLYSSEEHGYILVNLFSELKYAYRKVDQR
jgi:hypothetical protein